MLSLSTSSTVRSIRQSQVTSHFQMPKSHGGHGDFGQLPKPLKKSQINHVKSERNSLSNLKDIFRDLKLRGFVVAPQVVFFSRRLLMSVEIGE